MITLLFFSPVANAAQHALFHDEAERLENGVDDARGRVLAGGGAVADEQPGLMAAGGDQVEAPGLAGRAGGGVDRAQHQRFSRNERDHGVVGQGWLRAEPFHVADLEVLQGGIDGIEGIKLTSDCLALLAGKGWIISLRKAVDLLFYHQVDGGAGLLVLRQSMTSFSVRKVGRRLSEKSGSLYRMVGPPADGMKKTNLLAGG
jgi:hypothetical protein